MPFRDLNEMDKHDGTNQRIDFGGPFDLVVNLNGTELYRGQVTKADSLYLSYAPRGEAPE